MEAIVKQLRDKGYSYECSLISNKDKKRYMDIKVYHLDDIIYQCNDEVSVGSDSDQIFVNQSISHSRNNKINEILWKR